MEPRHLKEARFQDNVAAQGARGSAGKYYSIAQSSSAFYEQKLQEHGAGRRALDFGSGNGHYSFFLGRLGARVTGIDISTARIRECASIAAEEGLDRVDFRVMNAEALEFDAGTFDLIYGGGILHHLDLSLAVPEIARTLKPQGWALFTEPLGHNPLINLFRWLTPHLRTEDEHPLRMADLDSLHAHFGHVEAHYFHLLTLLAVPLRGRLGFQRVLHVLERLDQALFRWLPILRRYAWMVVLAMSQPRQA